MIVLFLLVEQPYSGIPSDMVLRKAIALSLHLLTNKKSSARRSNAYVQRSTEEEEVTCDVLANSLRQELGFSLTYTVVALANFRKNLGLVFHVVIVESTGQVAIHINIREVLQDLNPSRSISSHVLYLPAESW